MSPCLYNTSSDSFQALWQRCLPEGVADDKSIDIYRRLIQAYSEPQRIYHTLKHIDGCFVMFEKIRHLANNPDALALAIWFHDAIYELNAGNNEQRSADWFMKESDGLFDENLRRLVYAHIMATLHCGRKIQNPDSKLMIDIDLSSFGLSWPEFLHDSNNVRKEQSDISDEAFYRKQCGFQKELLERPRFFQSDYFFEHHEKQARRNLTDYFTFIGEKLSWK